jgi:hypothetical protein
MELSVDFKKLALVGSLLVSIHRDNNNNNNNNRLTQRDKPC